MSENITVLLVNIGRKDEKVVNSGLKTGRLERKCQNCQIFPERRRNDKKRQYSPLCLKTAVTPEKQWGISPLFSGYSRIFLDIPNFPVFNPRRNRPKSDKTVKTAQNIKKVSESPRNIKKVTECQEMSDPRLRQVKTGLFGLEYLRIS